MQKRHFLSSLLASFMLIFANLMITGTVQAQEDSGYYVPIQPAQPTENPAKIEVVEFFSYGCPHCNDFHPVISKWAAKLPSDINFRRVPVSFGRSQWANLSKLYYAAETIGELGRLDNAIFDALHNKNVRLYDEKTIIDWVARQGVDKAKFTEAFNSFGVASKVKRADQLAEGSKIQGVPAISVDGRYLVVGKNINSYEDLLAITDKVIGKARSTRAK